MSKKPSPPSNLWEKMQAALEEVQAYQPPKPEGAFTAREFKEQFKLTDGQTAGRLQKLQDMKKIKRGGSSGRNVYYTFID